LRPLPQFAAAFNAIDFKNKTFDCPAMDPTKPAAGETFRDDEIVRLEGKLNWPGDDKPGYRIKNDSTYRSARPPGTALCLFPGDR
jgi:hypothetical protein